MTESNDQSVENPTDAPIEHGEVVDDAMAPIGDGAGEGDAVTSPAKVMRIGSMVKALLEEVRAAPLDEPSRERLAEIYERSVVELSEALSPDLQEELKSLALPFQDGVVPSESEIRVAKAQLVGWLEGLFHGIQATLFAQQLAARQQLEQMRQLPPGAALPPELRPPSQQPTDQHPGTYL
ncbi:MAG TPA: bacterial proteasome activator family protein [Desertimonas sp.]|nr:bacterial proteasome activator family protein [Desertimonas sp.]